jgi:5,10-methylenetetrahydromethanopterin reductase
MLLSQETALSPFRFHLGFPAPSITDLRMPDNAPLASLSEELGFDALWHSNQRFHREMFVRMASSAIATERITLGGAVADPFAVHPVLTAQALATVDELSGGRAMLALGAGGSGFQMIGVRRRRSAQALREAYQVIKALLAGDEVTFQGEIVQAHSARLEFQLPHPASLWVATRGDQTLETAGEYSDGVIIATYAMAAGVGQAMELVARGANRARRVLENMRIMSRVDTCVHPDARAAYAGARGMLARALWSSYPDRNFVHRANLEVPEEIESLIARRDYSLVPQAARQLPDEFVERLTWAGTPSMVAERVAQIALETGIREFGFWVLLAEGQSREEAMRLVAEEVIPRVKAAARAGSANSR